jgi:hypothetical protein
MFAADKILQVAGCEGKTSFADAVAFFMLFTCSSSSGVESKLIEALQDFYWRYEEMPFYLSSDD